MISLLDTWLPCPYSPRIAYNFVFTTRVSWSVQGAPGEPRTGEEEMRVRVRQRERNILYLLGRSTLYCKLYCPTAPQQSLSLT